MAPFFSTRLPFKGVLLPILIGTVLAGSAGYVKKAASTLVATQQPKSSTSPPKKFRLRKPSPLSGDFAEPAGASASTDFDGDGQIDLAIGFRTAQAGEIRIFTGLGNYNFSNAVHSISAPFSPDFMVAGDFNGDGLADLAAAGNSQIAIFSGDGHGNFSQSTLLPVDGLITALAAGSSDRLNGSSKLAAGISGPNGPGILVIAEEEKQFFSSSATVSGLSSGQFSASGSSDIIATAGSELIVINSKNAVTRSQLNFHASSPILGKFNNDRALQLAVLDSEGNIRIIPGSGRSSQTSRDGSNNGELILASLPGASQIAVARLSSTGYDDIVATDRLNSRVSIVSFDGTSSVAHLDTGRSRLLNSTAIHGKGLDAVLAIHSSVVAPVVIAPEAATTFTVNSTLDTSDLNPGDGICNAASSGPAVCTLRAAIQEANANAGADKIIFNIGSGVQTIAAGTAFPTITEAVTIDGAPLAGAPVTQSIVIDGTNAATCNSAFTISSGNSIVRKLTISGFACDLSAAIRLNQKGNNTIEGNILTGNGFGIIVDNSSANRIGTPSTGNIISGNHDTGIYLVNSGSTGNLIQANQIGISPTGTTGNQTFGIYLLAAPGNTIGGVNSQSRNIVAGNDAYGIAVTATGNFTGVNILGSADGQTIQGNYLGLASNGVDAPGNGSDGIVIVGSNSNIIGGTGAGNVITGSGMNKNLTGNGVYIFPDVTAPGNIKVAAGTGNLISSNSIYANNGRGINLGGAGIVANDAGDPDTGPNKLQNFPVLNYAVTRSTGTTIRGTLNSSPSQTFTVEFFGNTACDPSGNGEGQTFLGKTSVTTDASGNASYSFSTQTVLPAGAVVTATATDQNSNTSEFSACFQVKTANADLVLDIGSTPSQITTGTQITYNYTVTNSGPDDATGIVFLSGMTIPNGHYTVVSATTTAPSGSCSGTSQVSCNLGNLAPNASTTVKLVLTPTIDLVEPAINSVTAANAASATSIETDPNLSNNAMLTTTFINALADLYGTWSVSPALPASATPATLTLTLGNNGPSVAGGVKALVTLPSRLLSTSCAAPAGWTCTGSGSSWTIQSTTASLVPIASRFPAFTFKGTVDCLGQNANFSATAVISSSTQESAPANNTAVLNVTAQAGNAAGIITYDAGGTALQLGPLTAGSGAEASASFTLRSTSCLPMVINSLQFLRADNAATPNLASRDDSRYFSLRLINSNGSETVLNPSGTDRDLNRPIPFSATLASGQSLRFKVVFSPAIPFFAGTFARSDLGINANQVLPDQFNSQLVVNFTTGAVSAPPVAEATGDTGTITALITAKISPAVQIIPREGLTVAGGYLVTLDRIKDEFRIKVSVFDSNKNVTKITYQFYDTFNQPASSVLEVNVTDLVKQSALYPGQCYTLQQDFTGAGARPDVTKVRVTVTDGDGATVGASSAAITGFPNLAEPTVISGRTEAVIQLQPIQIEGIRLPSDRGTKGRAN